MINLKKIVSNEEMQKLVTIGKAEYFNWTQKVEEIAFVGRNIYWKYNNSHFRYLGKKDMEEKGK